MASSAKNFRLATMADQRRSPSVRVHSTVKAMIQASNDSPLCPAAILSVSVSDLYIFNFDKVEGLENVSNALSV